MTVYQITNPRTGRGGVDYLENITNPRKGRVGVDYRENIITSRKGRAGVDYLENITSPRKGSGGVNTMTLIINRVIVEILQSHIIFTMSYWSSGLPVCFPPQGTQVQIPWGVLCETRILLLALSSYVMAVCFTL